MNKSSAQGNGKELSFSFLKTPVLLAISILLATMFWMASLPLALGASVSPADLIQAHLPHAMSLGSAPKPEMLSAVCKAITQNHKNAPEIVRAAASARKELTADILKTAVHCLKGDGENPDCALARATLKEVIAVDADEAASLTEIFVGLTPGCVDSPEEGPDGNPANVSSLSAAPGSGGGGGGASGEACSVCHNNQSIQVACGDLANYLTSHPGDTAGACEATPNANR